MWLLVFLGHYKMVARVFWLFPGALLECCEWLPGRCYEVAKQFVCC